MYICNDESDINVMARRMEYLMNILRRIQYSKIGRVIFKKGPLLEMARSSRRAVLKVLTDMEERRNRVERFVEVLDSYLIDEVSEIPYTDEVIDVIIPIYNGYEYLEKLFECLPKTKMKCRFILVDDMSPDIRVKELENRFVQEHENAILIQNDQNYGFVKSINNGLEKAKGHVALVNTDTELPEGWLERLMYPILFEKKVATTTPYTNSGTIFSFPNMGVNNAIYRGLDVDTIDKHFKKAKLRMAETPTGVGFCMGMNKEVIDKIGFLDYETYDRGYAEENDWCQRALKKGYRHVQVENLFVYHKHGGSFLSEEKAKLIENHLEKLKERFPTYDGQVNKFVTEDPNRRLRELMQMVIDTNETKSILCFDHNLSGGATSYLEKQKCKWFQEDACVTIVRYDFVKGRYVLLFENGEIKLRYSCKNLSELLYASKWIHYDEIYINELVTYPKLWETLDLLVELKEKNNAKLIMLMHDYFALCPTINLVTEDFHYCGMPGGAQCENCYNKKNYVEEYQCASQTDWIKRWNAFFEKCTEVRAFSEDTYKRVENSFSGNYNLTLVPHQVNYMVPIHKNHTWSKTVTIGLLGVLIDHKGSRLIEEMLQEIEKKNLDVRIVLIGKVTGTSLSKYKNFKETGEYHVAEIPKLVYENDIDIFMMASIWPETFSYTTDEVIKMGMPVASFDFGAPAERIKEYEKGLILSKREAETVLREIELYVKENCKKESQIIEKKKVIYIAEYISFSSRYRLEHLKEELLYMGVDGELWETNDLPQKREWADVEAVVIYRCRDMEPLSSLITEIKETRIPLYYDIDDFIFDYNKIKGYPFFQTEEYKDFDVYTSKIFACMEKMDGLIVSTEHMKLAVKESFPGKPVYVNRNVASAEMMIHSLLAYETRKTHKGKIILGYFSGSNTHSEDFDLISDVLLEVMKERQEVYLKVVGCLELSDAFKAVEDRVIREGFMDWRDLPKSIAECDINLMPLVDSFFHRCKSENKWMEAGFVHVPTIGSYNKELDDATRNGENVILCRTEEEWKQELLKLVDDKEYRMNIAGSAFAYMIENKNTLSNHQSLFAYIFN